MGLLDKLKNVFFEEEEVEVEEKPKKDKIKKEKPLVKKIENPKKEKKEEKQEKREIEKQPIVEEKIEETNELDLDFTKAEENGFEDDQEVIEKNDFLKRTSDQNFKFPVILDDEERIEEDISVANDEYKEVKWDNNIYGDERIDVSYESNYHKEPYSNSYTRDLEASSYSLRDIPKEEKTFKPSPVISPVYGVLDLNYTKDDVKEKAKPEREPIFSFSSNKLDLDDVRAKAFGLNESSNSTATEIEDDIEQDAEQDDIDIDLDFEENANETIDMTNNGKPVVDSVTVGDAEEYFEDLGLEYNVDYKDSKKKVKAKTAKEESKEDISKEDAVITDKPKRKKKEKEEDNDIDIDIEDNLFDLIDSMYDEGE